MANVIVDQKLANQKAKLALAMTGMVVFSLMLLILLPSVFYTQTKDLPAMAGSMFFFIFLDAFSAFMYFKTKKNQKTVELEIYNALFFKCLGEHNNKLTAIDFAKYANISGDKARSVLEAKISEFGGTVDVTERGGIVYNFETGD